MMKKREACRARERLKNCSFAHGFNPRARDFSDDDFFHQNRDRAFILTSITRCSANATEPSDRGSFSFLIHVRDGADLD